MSNRETLTKETNTSSAAAAKVDGVQEAVRSTPTYTADNVDSKSVAADGHAIACDHKGYHFCKICGEDLTPDIPCFSGTYGDGPNTARSLG